MSQEPIAPDEITATPVNILWDGILLVPVFGVLDSLRAQVLMDTMLARIIETRARVIILDIAGVDAVDTAVANHIIQITRATALMGCECVISGISPAVAQALVHLGIDLGQVTTRSTLADALGYGFRNLGLRVEQIA